MVSLCFLNHDKVSICPVTSRGLDPEISPNPLSSPQMPPFSETLVIEPMRSNTVRFSTVPRTVRSDTKLYNTVPNVFDAVQYGTPCNPDFVPIMAPFSFVEGLKISKHNNTRYKSKYKKNPLVPH